MRSTTWASVGFVLWSASLGACGDDRLSSSAAASRWRPDGAAHVHDATGSGGAGAGTGGSATNGGSGGAGGSGGGGAKSGGHGGIKATGGGGHTGGGSGTGAGGARSGGAGGAPSNGGAMGVATGGAGAAPSGSGGQPSGGAPGSGGGAGMVGATGGDVGTGGATDPTNGPTNGGGGIAGASEQTGGSGTGGGAAGASAETGGAGMGGSGAGAGAGGQGNTGGMADHEPCADSDPDHDGVNDCVDRCPGDPVKVNPGVCGCGISDADRDLDGVLDCRDSCPTDPTRAAAGPCGAGPAHCDLTWMTVSNIYAEMGPLEVLIDGYLTRIPRSNFYGGGGGLQNTYNASLPDVTAVSQVLAALGGGSKIDLLLTGHSHFDHSFDTGTWSFLTGAPIVGAKTTCFQAVAQGMPSQRCTEVLGGEKILISPGVTLRVIRWNHSGDSASNPEQHNPVELAAVPLTDPVTGGLRAGVAEDFPNGGGGRAFLFTIDGVDGPYSWFFTNSGGAIDLDVPVMVDGINYGAPLQNLKAAMADAQLAAVDLWVGAGGDPVARLVLPVAKPKAYLPVHWDNFYAAFRSRPAPFNDAALAATLSAQGVTLIKPVQVMDKWRLDRKGVQPIANTAIKQALNIQ